MSEKLKEVVEQEDESQIVAQDAHDDYYDSRSIIPADNVDADGVPWVTVGENIRQGKNLTIDRNLLTELFSALIGSEVKIIEAVCTIAPSTDIKVDNPDLTGGPTGVYLKKSGIISLVLVSDVKYTSSYRFPLNIVPNTTPSSFVSLRNSVNDQTRGTISLILIVKK